VTPLMINADDYSDKTHRLELAPKVSSSPAKPFKEAKTQFWPSWVPMLVPEAKSASSSVTTLFPSSHYGG
jgi:hypothetical protein